MNETQELVTIIPWTFLAQILNLFIQLFLLKKFLFRPISEVLEKRRAVADSVIHDAQLAKQEADRLKAGYEAHLLLAEAEASQILQHAQKDAAYRSDSILQEAQKQAADMKAKAEAELRTERKRAVNEIKNEIGSIAMEIAGKVIEREINEDDHRKLIDQFIKQAGEAS